MRTPTKAELEKAIILFYNAHYGIISGRKGVSAVETAERRLLKLAERVRP